MTIVVLMLAAIASVVSWQIARALLPPVLALLSEGGLVRQNFRGLALPVGAGIVIPLASLGPWLFLFLFLELQDSAVSTGSVVALWVSLLFGMALLGLLDDAVGSREQSGFSGHLAALLDGRPSTGSLKALFGGGLALLAGFVLHGPTVTALIAAAVVALAANAVNLLDVRPGRALKGAALLSFLAVIGCLATPPPLPVNQVAAWAAPFGASLALWREDHKGSLMLGDSGANVLGASAGLLAASSPLVWQGGLLLLLVLLHLYSEKRSLSELIEAVPILARVDRWGR